MSGTIPPALGTMPQLEVLSLDANPLLSGTIPGSVGGLTRLKRLWLGDNIALSGSIPTLVNCSSLRTLHLGNSTLTKLPASLPPSITHLYDLLHLVS